MKKLLIPALRGRFGDWVYYSCLVPFSEVAERISFANDIHKNKNLSDMIQREIKQKRGLEIAKYLTTEKERFFNSLVVAVYKGDPIWYEVDLKTNSKDILVEDIPDFAWDSFGFLSLTGEEHLFAIDGQHRLAGIKKVINEQVDNSMKKGLIADQISILFVAHKDTPRGLQRTRRLFTTLNKTAIPVSKGEKIALDENDVMAIIARRLVEENPKFSGDHIAYKPTNNLPVNDFKSLTTLGNLYDVLSILFSKIIEPKKEKLKELQFYRPDDQQLNQFYETACNFFHSLELQIPELREYFESKNYTKIVKKYRGNFGGSLVFRPIGLTLILEIVERLVGKYGLEQSIKLIAKLPRDLSRIPYADVLWNTKSKTIINKHRVLARNLLLYMLGEQKASEKLLKGYADAIGKDLSEVTLPTQLKT
jgi:DNA sulfur modification protein DndB